MLGAQGRVAEHDAGAEAAEGDLQDEGREEQELLEQGNGRMTFEAPPEPFI